MLIDRRTILQLATLGTGALLLPGGRALAATLAAERGFTHGIASGEPAADSMLLWTRFVGSGADAQVRVEIAETADFTRVVSGAEMITGPWRDWTVKLTVTGLTPGRPYHYRFIGPDGTKSPVGRTKTLPAGSVDRFTLAIFSCSNIGFGWFNAYGHAAARADLDLAVHVGDYLYEMKRGAYPSPEEAVRLDAVEPSGALIHLADYRTRYGAYRRDPDLAALHARLPMVLMMDDHESANDSWEGGAEGQNDTRDGPWALRRAAALQAYYEWMPVADRSWASYTIGGLATLYRTESRLTARSRQFDPAKLVAGAADPVAALAAFKANGWRDDAQAMFGSVQEAWLNATMAASVRAGTVWQLLGSPTNMGYRYTPAEALEWIGPNPNPRVLAWTQQSLALSRAGLPNDFDNWGGYPAARARVLGMAQGLGANFISLSGDSHNAWAFNLAQDGRAAGVDCGGQSVTSPGIEHATPRVAPATIARALTQSSPELLWGDTARRGYMALELTPARATNAWIFMETVKRRSLATGAGQRLTVEAGRNQFAS